ncbi:uncharacterized protein At4g19900 isoform X2 [Oryza sativa Japonica Group]|uniref:Os07g0567300 protein n=3 Tax=Oryza TaxID=4527 RepID=Q84SM4_ORYSJ|nr:uncharacterized protein At4g19900 isoform X2 [Oryza sativa Japonica Group]KAB8105961.1 hypothetical protein EE612_040098 [Oryza sativa]KAF2923473.1 hypothetical protein DAI22_07g194100 [Oryza sativa Japonica Group]BAC55659.1 unknown protein [Oryza sativa Japonica Group]BAT02192.1 Os07g0567300 [Oryza sativa Japonica Group]
MLPRSHSHPAARRRSGLGAQLCAVVAALLLLVSLAVLHSRLSSSSSSPFPLSSSGDGVSNSSLVEDEDDGAAVLDPTVTITATTTTTTTTTNAAADSTTDASSVSNPEDDPIDELDVLDEDTASGLGAADEVPASASASSLVWDHAVGVARLPFRLPAAGDPLPAGLPHLEPAHRIAAAAFGSDDEPVDLELRVEISSIAGVEDALLLKPASSAPETPLRAGWARWLEGKADYLRRDRMLRSNLEFLNPRNHPLLQDPDSPGLTSLTRGDRMVHRMLLAEIEKAASKNFERRSLQSSDIKQGMGVTEKVQQRRWGYYPGIDPHLGFNEFMEKFFEHGKCSVKVFMVWNSPQWAYGVRHQRGLESLLRQHPEACVVMLSETLELEFFQEFVKEGYKVAVALPNLDELLEGTLTHDFVSVWNEWRKTKYYPLHYSELVRLAALYKYGGIYLDSDVVVLKPLNALRNSIGVVKQVSENSSFSGAVLAFEKNSPFLAECLKEFHSTYDDELLQWNGAELMTRVIRNMSDKADDNSGHLDIKFEPSVAFYPISSTDITRYFSEADSTDERAQHDALFSRIVNDSTTFHLWNSITSSLVPEPNSLVERILNRYCLHCLDVL